MRKLIIVGNWKMNGSKEQAKGLIGSLAADMSGIGSEIDRVICPAFPYLDYASILLRECKTDIQLGAQNLTPLMQNAFTGEISAAMLREFNCTYVIIGHSERRRLLFESENLISDKVNVALQAGLTPILCVGETEEEYVAGNSAGVITNQLEHVLDNFCIDELKTLVIAYEPIWAIGTGKSAGPLQVQLIHAHIRQVISEADKDIAAKIRIIYGGSVNNKNAAEILEQPDIDGCLVGGASLKAQEFSEICHIAMGITR